MGPLCLLVRGPDVCYGASDHGGGGGAKGTCEETSDYNCLYVGRPAIESVRLLVMKPLFKPHSQCCHDVHEEAPDCAGDVQRLSPEFLAERGCNERDEGEAKGVRGYADGSL